MTLLRNSSLAAVAALVLTGSRFALAAILARRLSSSEFGQFIYAQWLVDMSFLVCSLGATGAVSRYVAEYRSDEAKLAVFICRWRMWALILPFLAGGAVSVGGYYSGLHLSLPSIILLSVWAVANGTWAMQTSALIGLQRFDLIFYANLQVGITLLVGVTMLPLSSNNSMMLFGLMAAACSLASLFGTSEIRRFKATKLLTLDADQWKSIKKYALNMWLIALLWALIWSRGELPVVRLYLGDAGVAHYAAVLTLFSGAIQGVMLGISAVAPQLTRLWGEGRKEVALATARNVMDFQLLICGFAAIALICFGPELLVMIFGEKYRDQAPTLAIMSIGLISMALSNQNHLLQIATNGRFSRNSSIAGTFILIILSFTLIPYFGIVGAAVSRVSTMIVLGFISIVAFNRLWGSSSLGLWNLTGVALVVLCGFLIVIEMLFVTVVARLIIFLSSCAILLIVVRDIQGRPKVFELTSLIWRWVKVRLGQSVKTNSGSR